MDSWTSPIPDHSDGKEPPRGHPPRRWHLGPPRLIHSPAAPGRYPGVDPRPDLAPADSPLHDLGLGVYLAHSQARSLLPDDYQLPDVDEDAEFEQRTPRFSSSARP